MEKTPGKLENSTQTQSLLRAVALWAVHYAEQALPIFESRHPEDARPRQAVEACLEFAHGKKRDKNLRMASMAALRAAKDVDEASKYAARAAMLAAAVAYTHTDLQTGLQGVRQAQHVLGPVVYAALALETAEDTPSVGDIVLEQAITSAPKEVGMILQFMPPQLQGSKRVDVLFAKLDAALRNPV